MNDRAAEPRAARARNGKAILVIEAVLGAVLLCLGAVHAARLVRRELVSGAVVGRDIAALKRETIRFLEDLAQPVVMTYFVSAPRAMPPAMKPVGPQVETLLAALKRRAPERLDYRVIDPQADPHGAAYASRKGASPVNVRRVLRDEASEQPIWSSLSIAHGRHRDTLIQGIMPGDLPYLERLILRHLEASREPIQPLVAVAAPPHGFDALAAQIAHHIVGQVFHVDLDGGAPFPSDADLLFWIAPRSVSERRVEELRRFLASGRSAVLAGSTYEVQREPAGDRARYRIVRSTCDWDALLRPFGLRMAPLLLTDTHRVSLPWPSNDGGERSVETAFQIRVLPRQLDTRSLLGPPAGQLVIASASPIEPDPAALAARGLTAEIVATTSESTGVLDLPEDWFDEALLDSARDVPKQPWLVLLKPSDPWQGRLLVSGSSMLFHDTPYRQERNANAVFLRTLVRTFTDGPLLARIRVERTDPEPLPAMSTPERIAWRAATVFLVPAVLLLLVLRGRTRANPRAAGRARAWCVAAGTLATAAVILVCLALSRDALQRSLRLDLTEEKIHTPSPLTRRLIDAHRGELRADLVISDGLYMPSFMKGVEPAIRWTLRDLGIPLAVIRPEDLPPAGQDALRSEGLGPFQVERVQDDTEVTARIWSGLRLRLGASAELIPHIDERMTGRLEFLIAAAVQRLQAGRAPHVAVLSDLPRLSPAEAHADYQQKGYAAPVGADVYSFAKDLLARHGYRVSYINPESPVFPDDMDLLIWLQPRFPQRAIAGFSAYMAAGGKAIVALQHYNIQQRQYRGRGFSTVYWPQPQYHRFNAYLDLLGLRQVGEKIGDDSGEILFDRTHGRLQLDTQVNRSAFREHDPQEVARPFLIRVSAEGLARTSVVTSRLGELLFIWGNRFVIDAEAMEHAGIRRQILARTSPRAWTYAWSGGWIPEESFEQPSDPADLLDGPQPLAVLIEGRFPAVEMRRDQDGRDELVVLEAAATATGATEARDGGREGQMLLIGCSEMFKNRHVYSPRRQHDQLLLNATALLSHGEEMAEILARRPEVTSFPFQPPGKKASLRVLAIGLAPLGFVLFGLLRAALRRPVLCNR